MSVRPSMWWLWQLTPSTVGQLVLLAYQLKLDADLFFVELSKQMTAEIAKDMVRAASGGDTAPRQSASGEGSDRAASQTPWSFSDVHEQLKCIRAAALAADTAEQCAQALPASECKLELLQLALTIHAGASHADTADDRARVRDPAAVSSGCERDVAVWRLLLHSSLLCCAVLCCAVLCCAVLCCAVLCCDVL
jgi:hypothetical protein